MRKFVMCLILLLFVCTSCAGSKQDETPNMGEMLKISTWLLDKELEGNGRWGYLDPLTRTYPRYADGDGYWIPNDGVTQVENEDVFVYEALEVGVPRIMAPMTMSMARSNRDSIRYGNLQLRIDYEGIVEVIKIEPTGSSIRIVDTSTKGWNEVEEIRTNGPCTIMICPVGKETVTKSTEYLLSQDTLVDKEYTLQIRGCSYDGTPIITTEIKITAIPDPEYPWETVHEGHYAEMHQSGEERTRFCLIELVSYTYSEMYLLMGEGGTDN